MEKVANVKASKVTETINGNLVLTREPIMGKDGKQLITKDGRQYFSYVVNAFIRGQEKKIDFMPKDKGGYEPLDILFDISPKAELILREEEMTDNEGRKSKYLTYTAQVIDEDGEIWDCSVKPQRDSDKALLKFALICLEKKSLEVK